jgi:DnaJ-class molecular chaperone
MICPNCNNNRFIHMQESWECCTECGHMVCRACAGTGAVDAPFSGSDPSCQECDGEGTFNPNYESTEVRLGNPDRRQQ